MCVSGMTCGGERTNESDERHVYLQQICGACISRKLMTCIQSALFRHVAARRGRKATARQNAGHYGKWPNWANAPGQPPARLRGGLHRDPRTSAWGLTSRKGALCATARTQNALLREVLGANCAFP